MSGTDRGRDSVRETRGERVRQKWAREIDVETERRT